MYGGLRTASWALCVVSTVAWAAWLVAGHLTGDLGCEDPAGSSNYGHARWQWWPPGTTCSYHQATLSDVSPAQHVTAHVDQPGVVSAAVTIGLAIWLIANIVATRHFRRRGMTPPQIMSTTNAAGG